MNFSETLKLAFDAIWAHKLRSFLTLLGVIIGVMTFMIVVSMLLGFKAYVDEKLAGIGSNSFTIRRFSFDDFKDTDTIAAAQRRNKELTFEELNFIKERAQLIDKIGAKALPNVREVKRGSESVRDIRIDGAEPIIRDIEKLDIAEGRYFTDAENDNAVRVCYVGMDVAKKLFPQGDAIGGEITIQGIPYKIIGIQTAKGTVFGQPQDSFVQFPIKTYGANFGGLRNSRGLFFVATSKNDKKMDDAVEEVRMLMRIKRKQTFDEKDTFGILTPDAIAGLINRITGPIGTVILFVPTIALLVGAIVVMNIMLVSVTERTREIGIRKAVGAKQRDILMQFLIEAATLTGFGGIMGLLVGWLLSFAMQLVLPSYIPWAAPVVGFAASVGIGLFFGLWPAWKAARLDPIESLRYE
ncbi:MAG: ABC transporter permease [Pyrinomonadaceae bacterium]